MLLSGKYLIIILEDHLVLTVASQLDSQVRFSRTWTPELCHTIITNQVNYLDVLERCGRGVWTRAAENFCLNALWREEYADIKYVDVVKAMSEAAMQPDGYTHSQIGFDAFAFCHKMGFLHTEPLAGTDDRKITYVFASPVHRRYTMTIRKMMVTLTLF